LAHRKAPLRSALSELDRLNALFGRWSSAIFAEQDTAIAAAEESERLGKQAMSDVA
jgi:hypothetical protein